MHHFALALCGLIVFSHPAAAQTILSESHAHARSTLGQRLAELEQRSGGRLGAAVIDTAQGEISGWRMDERFPLCSTSKAMAVAALLKRSEREPGLMSTPKAITRAALVNYNPVTEPAVGKTMTLAVLSEAALRYSDNAAMNLILDALGGPAAVTVFARTLGDAAFRLDRREPALNTALPGDVRDTTTPRAMATSLQKLTLGDALGASQRHQLVNWLRANTTGDASIRAGIPAGWAVGDKTGSGDYGTTNDIAVIWPPGRAPLVLVTYFTQTQPSALARRDVLAEAARIVVQGLEK